MCYISRKDLDEVHRVATALNLRRTTAAAAQDNSNCFGMSSLAFQSNLLALLVGSDLKSLPTGHYLFLLKSSSSLCTPFKSLMINASELSDCLGLFTSLTNSHFIDDISILLATYSLQAPFDHLLPTSFSIINFLVLQ